MLVPVAERFPTDAVPVVITAEVIEVVAESVPTVSFPIVACEATND